MKKAIQRISIVIGALLALFVAAAIIVPLVVDVDKYRPQILQAANERLNGKLDMGKLSLSLWGRVNVQVQGLSVTDPAGRKVVAVNDASFVLPYSSILSGAPQLVFRMENPELLVVKDKSGKLNVSKLMKEPAASGQPTSGQGTPAQPTTGSAPSRPAQLPSIVTRARLGVDVLKAVVNYRDEATGLTTQIKDMNLKMRDLSLTRRTDIELWANLDTRMGQSFWLKGPARLVAHAQPELVGGAFDHVVADAQVDLNDLEMGSGTAFHKAKGIPMNAELALTASSREAKVDRMRVKFHNAEVKGGGTVTNLGAAPAGAQSQAPSPIVNFTVASNEIELKAWTELVPMLKEYELGGTLKLDGSASGPTDKLGYKGKLALNAFTAKAPKLKAQPRFDGVVEIATDQIQNLTLTMKAPGNDATLKGKLVSFSKPQGSFELTSSGMDLDQLVEWPPAATAGAPAKGATPAAGGGDQGGAPAKGGATAHAADYDATLDPLRSSPVAANANVVLHAGIKSLKAKNIRMGDLSGRLFFRNLSAGLEGFSMKLWQGAVKGSFSSQLKPKAPTYAFSFSADGLQLKDAVADNVQVIKNTVVGKAAFGVSGTGASFNPEPAKANLNAKGSMKIEDAAFTTVDVGRMAVEAVNKAIERVGDKIPGAKGKTVGAPGGRESKYKLVSSDFTIAGGKFNAPNFAATAEPNQGIDLKGSTELGLKDYGLNAAWTLIDTYNMTKARDLSVDVAGTKVEHVLAEGNKPVSFTVHVGCTALQPCYSYTEVPEQLAKVALANVSGAATEKAKSEVRKRVESAIPKSAPPAIQDALKGFGKKLFQ